MSDNTEEQAAKRAEQLIKDVTADSGGIEALTKELGAEGVEKFFAEIRYRERFGTHELVFHDDLPKEYQSRKKITELYKRCLKEGKPIRQLIKLPERLPGIIYH